MIHFSRYFVPLEAIPDPIQFSSIARGALIYCSLGLNSFLSRSLFVPRDNSALEWLGRAKAKANGKQFPAVRGK